MNVVVFEDEAFRSLLPLTYSRPVFFLRSGAFTVAERVRRQFPKAQIHYLCRDYLTAAVQRAASEVKVNESPSGEAFFVNGAALCDGKGLRELFEGLISGGALIRDARLVAAKAGGTTASNLFKALREHLSSWQGSADRGRAADVPGRLGMTAEAVQVPLASYSWEYVASVDRLIDGDWTFFEAGRSVASAEVSTAAALIGRDRILIGEGVRVESGVVLDASEGPVTLERGVEVRANSVIYGPCHIGERSLIKAGARIYGPCSFGPVCKLAGEITESIVQGYSNKQHEGFLGHAFLGEWVNIGAGTEVSDLKNNYQSIRVWVDGRMTDSGSMFVGPTIGDHTKTGINTTINSGTVIGYCCNVFGADYLPTFVPSFSWGGRAKLVEYDPEKAVETARTVMGRRGVEMDEVQEALFRKIYELSRPEREGIL